MPVRIEAEPYPIQIDVARTALVIIDMQRDFLEPGGFGETLGNDVSLLAAAVEPIRAVLQAARQHGVLVIHTREGHRPDLVGRAAAQGRARRSRDPHRRARPDGPHPGPRRARPRHHPELYPAAGEPVIDKPGKGAFYQTDLELMLKNRGIDTLMVCGVTTEVCVNTTVREANDRGFRCIALVRWLRVLFPGIPRSRASP